MLKIIVIVVIVLVAAVLAIAMTRPDSFRVERKTSIKSAPDKIFPLIDDFHNWSSWSPWERMDPAMRRTHSGAADHRPCNASFGFAFRDICRAKQIAIADHRNRNGLRHLADDSPVGATGVTLGPSSSMHRQGSYA